jgi:hypothetical protein
MTESFLLWISASIGKAPNNKKTAQVAALVGNAWKLRNVLHVIDSECLAVFD